MCSSLSWTPLTLFVLEAAAGHETHLRTGHFGVKCVNVCVSNTCKAILVGTLLWRNTQGFMGTFCTSSLTERTF